MTRSSDTPVIAFPAHRDVPDTTAPRTAFDKAFQLGGGRCVGDGERCFIVAELSGNHRGEYRMAADLIRAAKDAGADAVKLQTYTPATLTIDCAAPWFRVPGDGPWAGRTLWDLYREASTPWEWHADLFALARELEMEVFSTPFDRSAVDFLEKPVSHQELLDKVNIALEQQRRLSDERREHRSTLERLKRLTAREREVLACVLEANPSRTIGDKLGIALKTVEVHRSRIMDKMSAKNVAELVGRVSAAGVKPESLRG